MNGREDGGGMPEEPIRPIRDAVRGRGVDTGRFVNPVLIIGNIS